MDKRPFRFRPIPFEIIALWNRVKSRIASEPLTSWLGVFFTLALAAFTLALVNVAYKQTKILSHTDTALNSAAAAQIASADTSKKLAQIASQQTEILSNTDKALHAAAAAQTASAQTAEKLRLFTEATDRAWIGPTSARSDPFEAGKPIKIAVVYNNTGRLLASFKLIDGGTFFSKTQWSSGAVAAAVSVRETECMNESLADSPAALSGVAYPTTGFAAYTLTYNSNNPNIRDEERIILTNDLLSHDLIFVLFGCFNYNTGEGPIHHSFFCYYHETGISDDVNNLAFCPFGQRAD